MCFEVIALWFTRNNTCFLAIDYIAKTPAGLEFNTLIVNDSRDLVLPCCSSLSRCWAGNLDTRYLMLSCPLVHGYPNSWGLYIWKSIWVHHPAAVPHDKTYTYLKGLLPLYAHWNPPTMSHTRIIVDRPWFKMGCTLGEGACPRIRLAYLGVTRR